MNIEKMNREKLIKELEELALEYQLKSDKRKSGELDKSFELGVAIGLLKAEAIILRLAVS